MVVNQKEYLFRLSKLDKVQVTQMTLVEYLLINQDKDRVLKRYYKNICRTGIFELILFLVSYLFLYLIVPPSEFLNIFHNSVNPHNHFIYSIILSIVVWGIVDLLFWIYFRGELQKTGRQELIDEIIQTIYKDRKGVQLQLYSSNRLYYPFLKLEFDNLVDWFTAQNEFENPVTDTEKE